MDKAAAVKANFAANMARWMSAPAEEDAPLWERTQLDSAPRPAETPLDRLVNEALLQLALSGRVSPVDLVGQVPETYREQILNRVAEHCLVEVRDEQVRWLLQQAKRLETLQQLIADGQLEHALAGALPDTDPFGDALRTLLRMGDRIPIQNRTQDELLALMEALEVTQPLGRPQPDWGPIRLQISYTNFRTDQRLLLSNGFVGRRNELSQLRSFLADMSPMPHQPWQGVVLTGFGGAGKSTLLAKFADDVLDEQLATLILFDFDRPALNPGDPLWLEAEMARQIGYQYPIISDRLHQERAFSRQQKSQFEGNYNLNLSVSESVSELRSYGLLDTLRTELTAIQADTRPLLLILDTFEEVDQQNLTEHVLGWLRTSAEILSTFRLRVIFSGRLFDTALAKVLSVCNQRTIDLGELTTTETKTLLKRLQVNDELAQRVARSKWIPHRPLELKLLARMLSEKGDATLDEVEEELRSGGDAAKSLFMGIVYRRVLLRIGDEMARTLAYPGLVLRYVDVNLIRFVLGPVLGLSFTQAEAQSALDTLARHSWICYRGANGEVWHRRDLRRSMLSAMRAQQPDTARQISESAFAYFAKLDVKLSDARLQAEQTYHRLLWLEQPDEGAAYDLATLKNAAEFISADVQDLPKAAAVLLEYAQKGRVKAEDVALLPAVYMQKAYSRTGTRLVDKREFAKALRLYQRGQSHFSLALGEFHMDWEFSTLFATAQWEELKQAIHYDSLLSENNDPDAQPGPLPYFKRMAGLHNGSISANEPDFTIWLSMFKSVMANSRMTNTRQQYVKRMLMCTLFMFHEWQQNSGTSTPANLALLQTWVRQMRVSPSLMTSTHFQRKLLYLELWLPNQPLTLMLAPALLKIDPIWLTDLVTQPFVAELSTDMGRDLRQQLLDARALLTRKTVRQTLDALDVLYKSQRARTLDPIAQTLFGDLTRYPTLNLITWFRGPDSEYRDPVRFALLATFRSRADYQELSQLLASVVHLPFIDLDPVAFAEAMQPDPEHYLEPYIELVDRSWALGTLLERTAAARPGSSTLARVKSAYDTWDSAVKAAFEQFRNPGK